MSAPYFDDGGGIVIYHGDCRDVLPTLADVDHVITDPPYDSQTHDGARTSTRDRDTHAQSSFRIPIDFDPLDTASALPVLLTVARRWVIAFCALEMLGDYKRIGGDAWMRAGFWRRPNGTPQFTGDRPAQPGEGIAILHRSLAAGREGRARWNGGGRHAFYAFNTVHVDRVHPTQKPEALMRALVADFTDAGDAVLDPYMGSGTTLVACKRLGRRCVGIEMNERDCESAAQRLAQGALAFHSADGTP